MAQWAYVSPFELLKNTIGGSGYDIACAQNFGPIKFSIKQSKPEWENVSFNPIFKDNLFFLYLGKKQSSYLEVQKFSSMDIPSKNFLVKEISRLTQELISTKDFLTFNKLIFEHENIISGLLNYSKIKNQFPDFWGEIKSLGAWGGDFALVTSDKEYKITKTYFESKNLTTLIPFSEIIRQPME